MGDSADAALVARVEQGDVAAFAILYDRYSAATYGLAVALLGPTPAAEAVVEHTFLHLWRTPGQWAPPHASVRAGLLLRVLTVAHAYRRPHTGSGSDDASPAGPAGSPPAPPCSGALWPLAPDQQQVIALAAYGGYTHEEIAHLLGWPSAHVRCLLRHGLLCLSR